MEEDQRAEVPVFVLLYQSPPSLRPPAHHCVDTGQAGQGQEHLHLPEIIKLQPGICV